MKLNKFFTLSINLIVAGSMLLAPVSGQAAITRTDYVRSAYYDILDRFPTAAELKSRLAAYPGYLVLKRILNKLPERDTAIIGIYQSALKRNPAAGDIVALKSFLATSDQIRKQLFESKERTLAVIDIYNKYICRTPRQDELDFFVLTRTPFDRIRAFLDTHKERCSFFSSGALAARITAPAQAGSESLEILLDGSLSSAPAGATKFYQWSLVNGNGLGATIKNSAVDVATLVLSRDTRFADAYALAGDYMVQLTVGDGTNTSPPAFATVNVGFYTTFEKSSLDKVNALRAAEGQGAGPLTLNEKLTMAARKYSRYMRDNLWFNHMDKEGRNFDARVTAEAYNWQTVGENIGVIKSNMDDVKVNEETVQFMFNGWKNSPAHYANMIMKDFKEIGIGYSAGPTADAELPFQLYGSQEFGTSR